MSKWQVIAAALLGMVGVMLGAYAAHGMQAALEKQGLSEEVVSKRVEQCETGVRYHQVHAVVILVLGITPTFYRNRWATAATMLLLLGIALFSGGLYSMALLGIIGHWAIVPCGGLCLILGWLSLAVAAMYQSNPGAFATMK